MPNLYNCKSAGDQWRVTKFNEHFEPVEGSSYLCTIEECQCPAGVRPICRHREMLPKFMHRQYVNSGYFFDYDRGGWVQGPQGEEPESKPAITEEHTFLKGMTQTKVATINYMVDGSIEVIEHQPAPAKWRRF